VTSCARIIGDTDEFRGRLLVTDQDLTGVSVLRGFASNIRYATRREVSDLRSVQEGLGRPNARCAALIPIKKSEAWWSLAQDERREIFEQHSRHHSIGIRYLPEIARKLYHCRDLSEPFDFLTWFEFAPEHEMMFNTLVAELRASREWTYVTREIDIRLRREHSTSGQ
jgi:chlorite dismutase